MGSIRRVLCYLLLRSLWHMIQRLRCLLRLGSTRPAVCCLRRRNGWWRRLLRLGRALAILRSLLMMGLWHGFQWLKRLLQLGSIRPAMCRLRSGTQWLRRLLRLSRVLPVLLLGRFLRILYPLLLLGVWREVQ